MKFRKHALLCALVFLCTVFSTLPAVYAEEHETGFPGPSAATDLSLSVPSGPTRSVPLSNTPIKPAQYNGDVRDLPPEYAHSFIHFNNELD